MRHQRWRWLRRFRKKSRFGLRIQRHLDPFVAVSSVPFSIGGCCLLCKLRSFFCIGGCCCFWSQHGHRWEHNCFHAVQLASCPIWRMNSNFSVNLINLKTGMRAHTSDCQIERKEHCKISVFLNFSRHIVTRQFLKIFSWNSSNKIALFTRDVVVF